MQLSSFSFEAWAEAKGSGFCLSGLAKLQGFCGSMQLAKPGAPHLFGIVPAWSP